MKILDKSFKFLFFHDVDDFYMHGIILQIYSLHWF